MFMEKGQSQGGVLCCNAVSCHSSARVWSLTQPDVCRAGMRCSGGRPCLSRRMRTAHAESALLTGHQRQPQALSAGPTGLRAHSGQGIQMTAHQGTINADSTASPATSPSRQDIRAHIKTYSRPAVWPGKSAGLSVGPKALLEALMQVYTWQSQARP